MYSGSLPRILRSLTMTIAPFLMKLARLTACSLLAILMFVGVVQIGLRWESTQQFYTAWLALHGANSKPYLGLLSQNWSGDFILTDAKGDVMATFTPDRILSLTITSRPPAADPWRLILSLFGAALAAVVTAYGGLVATRSWVRRAPAPRKTPGPGQGLPKPGSRAASGVTST